MTDTKERKLELNEGIRLITVLLFFLFLTPGLLLPPKKPFNPSGTFLYYLAN